jgi:Protein of unknown function (DUF3048) N-terminal domain/Protein of unknown function (DUF3048) C-terminal domain
MDPQRRHLYSQRQRRPARRRRGPVVGVVIAAVAVGIGLSAITGLGRPSPASLDPGQVAARGSPSFVPPSQPVASPGTPSAAPIASPPPASSAAPSPTPVPTPQLVAAPLDGVLVAPKVAAQHPIAVMVDDLSPARPQSGFNSASVVWQAPAEGGIPRYMLVFQETIPKLVGPVRSARYYYIAWAAELRAVYAHAGGSPQALQTLRLKGSGQLVYNADEFRWGNSFWRVTNRFPPHNLYTDGRHLRGIAKSVGAKDQAIAAPWSFAPDLAPSLRPRGGRIEMGYLANHIRYDYDWQTNTYLRTVTGSNGQIDASTGTRVAPKNVVVMFMKFGPLNDGSHKHRLEAQVTGQGTAWIATNGTTIKGTWRKASLTAPTQFFDGVGHEVVLTVGQTFINVLQTGSAVTLKAGSPPPPEPVRGPLIPS